MDEGHGAEDREEKKGDKRWVIQYDPSGHLGLNPAWASGSPYRTHTPHPPQGQSDLLELWRKPSKSCTFWPLEDCLVCTRSVHCQEDMGVPQQDSDATRKINHNLFKPLEKGFLKHAAKGILKVSICLKTPHFRLVPWTCQSFSCVRLGLALYSHLCLVLFLLALLTQGLSPSFQCLGVSQRGCV